jgi:periplasmic protein TonB
VQAPTIVTVPNPPPVFVPTPAPPAPPPPPPAPVVSKAAGPKGDPSRFVTTDDYPPRALREGAEGTTRISWTINTQGRVENCRTVSSSGNADLDEAACRAMTRKGRFSPALDQNGNPIASTQSRNVRWQIPK